MDNSIDLLNKFEKITNNLKNLICGNDFSKEIESKCEQNLKKCFEILIKVETNLEDVLKENRISSNLNKIISMTENTEVPDKNHANKK